MSTTKNINKVSSAVISISIKVIIAAVVVLLLVRGAVVSYDFGHDIFYASSVDEEPGKDISVSIPEGCTASEAADILYSKGLIDNKLSFRVQAVFFEYDITAGEYTLNTSKTSKELLEELDAGPTEEEEKTS